MNKTFLPPPYVGQLHDLRVVKSMLYSGRHIWLGQYHQFARARRLGLFGHVARFSRDVPASNICTICCASGDGHPRPFLEAIKWTS